MENDRKQTMSDPDKVVCGHCIRPIDPNRSGLRHFGFSVAHQENECLNILLAEIAELQAVFNSVAPSNNSKAYEGLLAVGQVLLENDAEIGELKAKLAEWEKDAARVARLVRALEVIHAAIADGDGGSYWPARKFLDDADVYHGDLNDLRVLGAVAATALKGN